MTSGEFMLVIFLAPIFGFIGGILGRKVQRKMWLLDRPYAERVAALKGK